MTQPEISNMSNVSGQIAQAKGNGTVVAYSEDEIKHIPLTDIFADSDWNSRSKANVGSEANGVVSGKEGGEGSGIGGLATSLKTVGQDDPVFVRKVVDGKGLNGKKCTQPYELVAGFRRFEAISRLNADAETIKAANDAKQSVVPNTPNGTIRAVVKTLDAKGARALNVRENTSRDGFTAPDLVFGIREMFYTHKMSAVEIANMNNISLSYANVLIKISGINRKILEHWRNGGEFDGIASMVSATVNDMREISNLDPNRQEEEYKRVLVKRGPTEQNKDKQWLEAAKRKGTTIGALLARLQLAEFLEVGNEVTWVDVVDQMVKVGKKTLKAAQLRKIADAAEKSFTDTLEGKGTEEGEEGEE